MNYTTEISDKLHRTRQAKYCFDMMERTFKHVSEYPTQSKFETEGYRRSQIIADIRHLRRELLQLSRMI